MKKIAWGFIGCGDVTEVKSGPAFSKVDNSEVIAVMRRDAAKVKDYAQRHHISKYYTSADELIHDPDVNAVYVATPPSTHAEYTIRALEAGKPVYVEKPMACDYQACCHMLEASQKADLPVFVAYYRRCLPSFLKVKAIVDSGVLGEIRFVNLQLYHAPKPADTGTVAPWRVIPAISGGGYFYDLASHQLDLLDFILGPIRNASGVARNQAGLYEAEDVVAATLVFESGVVGSGLWCFTVDKSARQDNIKITGTKGSVSFASFEPEPIVLTTSSGIEEWNLPHPAHVQQPLIQKVVAALLDKGACPSTGVSAARTSFVMEQIIKG